MMIRRYLKHCAIMCLTSVGFTFFLYMMWRSGGMPEGQVVHRGLRPRETRHSSSSTAQGSNASSDGDDSRTVFLPQSTHVFEVESNDPIDYLSYKTLPKRDCLTMPDVTNATQLEQLRHCQAIFYNRAPKCGSRAVLSTFKTLGQRMGYNVYSAEKPNAHSFFPDANMLEPFVKNFSTFGPPFLYSQHLHFIDFSQFGGEFPVYINVIRDPLEGLISHYHFNMYGSHNSPLSSPRPHFNMSMEHCVERRLNACMKIHYIIPFFCGHNKKCRDSNAWTLNQARRHVDSHYLVVGITEDIPAFMEVMEYLMPHFFRTATDVFQKLQNELKERFKTAKKQEISQRSRTVLRAHLKHEYDFYYHVKRKFYSLVATIRRVKNNEEEPNSLEKMLSDI